MIDIIIPAYKAHDTIKSTLYSISCQRNSEDLNVYIVNDSLSDNYDTEINFFKKFLKIKELKYGRNKGPGYARQYGINNSKSEYIVFIDSDDIFENPLSLLQMYNRIKKNDADILCSSFLEQKEDGLFQKYSNDWIALHGKMYKRSFIEKNKIEFPFLYAEEDNAFNQLALLYNPKVSYLENSTYVWLYNENSIVRKSNYNYNNKVDLKYLESMYYVVNKAENTLNINQSALAKLCYKILVILYYYNFNYEKNNKFKNKIQKIYNCYLKNDTLLDEEKFEIQNLLANNFKIKEYINNILHPDILFDDYLKKIGDIND